MESLIPILNKLQPVSNAVGDNRPEPPRTAAAGSQGSGKSPAPEKTAGRSPPPKGTGTVTRTPPAPNPVHSPREPGPHRRQEDGTPDAEEHGALGHNDAILKDFDDIRSEIQRQTAEIAGHNKGIGDQEITLNMHSPRPPNPTLADPPGPTKLQIGDQPYNVETEIRNLVRKYIQYGAIIMAVVPANTDMATNESLKLAKDCDPKGHRTLVVLTKVDLMDAATVATDILTGKVIPVKLGIVAVVNRSQKDIADKKPIAQVIMDEAEFLRLKYPSLADCNGTSFLVATLKKHLLNSIKDYLVWASSPVERKILQAEALVDFYSDEDEEKDRGLMKIIREFSSAYSEGVRESGANSETMILIFGSGTPIYQIIHEIFKTKLDDILRIYCKEPIVRWFQTKNDPEECMKEMLQPRYEEMKKASIDCAQRVFEEMKQMLRECAYEKYLLLHKFPALRNKILVVSESLLRTKCIIAEKAIRDEIFYELWSRICDIVRFDENIDVSIREQFQIMTADERYLVTAVETVHKDVTVTIMLLVNDVVKNVEDELVGKFSSPGAGRIFLGDQNFSEERKKEKKSWKKSVNCAGGGQPLFTL